MDWKGEEDYGATLFRGMMLFAPKTAVVGLRHLSVVLANRSSLRVIMRLIYLLILVKSN